jgi:YggT family protein
VGFLWTFLRFFFAALEVLILARVVLSWLNPRFEGPVARLVFETTEPILAPIRRILPSTGMIDFSPIVAFLLIGLLTAAVGIR